MIRISGCIFALSLLCCTGCAHYIESRAIEKFVDALDQDDFQQLQASTSREFEQKALRLTAALDDMQILNLPLGETSVVNVEEVSEHEKKVTVKSEGSNRKVLYKLTKEAENDSWVVDDIYLKQKRDGVTAVRSVTEQMDLLLTVREFLASWRHAADRNDILHSCTPELKQVLAELPPDYLSYLSRRIAGEHDKSSDFQPEAKLDDNLAIVRLPRSSGDLLVTFQLHNEIWKVKNVALESKSDAKHIKSLAKHAHLMITAIQFLEAYQSGEQMAIQRLTAPKFGKILKAVDLASIPLNFDQIPLDQYQIQSTKQRGSIVIPGIRDYIRISLIDQADATEIDQEIQFVVDDVTLYSIEEKSEKRLSVMFQGQDIVRLFSEALLDRDIAMVRQLATKEFSSQAWRRIDANLLDELISDKFSITAPQIQSMEFQGAIAKVHAQQGQDRLTYILLDRDGQVRVDDILINKSGLPKSFKKLMSMLVPVKLFQTGLTQSQIPLIQRVCSDDFNRLVWRHLQSTPASSRQIAAFLQGGMYGYQLANDSAILKLGSNAHGAIVLLKEEHQQWVIDDVILNSSGRGTQQVRLKAHLREQVINLGKAVSSREFSENRQERTFAQNQKTQPERYATSQANISPFLSQQQSQMEIAPEAYRRITR